MAIGLVLRLAVSIGLTLGLPVYGYESEEHQAGYIFADSYDRDNAAWSLASSEEPVISAFKNEYLADQYGGLLSLMALQYRYLSPDAHRQMLPLLVSGIVFMLAVPFLWKALRSRWNRRVAFVAVLVFTFYPEAVLLSSAHMREPYLLCLASIATWAVISWEKKPIRSVIILAACFFGLALISWRSGVVVAGVLLAWLFLDIVMEKWQPNRRIWGWLLVVAGFLFVARLSYPWIRETAVYDTYLTVQSSGILQVVFKADWAEVPVADRWRIRAHPASVSCSISGAFQCACQYDHHPALIGLVSSGSNPRFRIFRLLESRTRARPPGVDLADHHQFDLDPCFFLPRRRRYVG